MRRYSVGKRAGLWVACGVAVALGVVRFDGDRGRARAGEKAGEEGDQAVVKARALVEALEARLRATESSLTTARDLLAQLEGGAPSPSPSKAAAGEDEGKRLEGVWRIAGINGHRGGEFRKPPYDEYKIMTAGHYLWLSFDPETGKVLRSGGGVYSLKGDTYTAKIECSNSDDLRGVIGQEYQGTCKIDGKTWDHFGTVPSGGVFDERWERVN